LKREDPMASEINEMNTDEKKFLAGCIKTMLLTDNVIDEVELEDLDALLQNLEFADYESMLEEFEDDVKDLESFWSMAKLITRPAAQDTILEVLDDIRMHHNFTKSEESEFMSELKKTWNK
jgi:hypothetical protein